MSEGPQATTDAAAAAWFAQATYQVRCEWGADGLARLAPADVVVVVDVLRFSTTVVRRLSSTPSLAVADLVDDSINGLPTALDAAATGALTLIGSLRNASALADAVLAEQRRRGARTSVAIIAAGERSGPGRHEPGAPLRFAIEDLLGAGAIVDALGARGIDHTSPEAAAASTAFTGMRVSLRHVLAASGSGRELTDKGLQADLAAACEVDASTVVPVLRGERIDRWEGGSADLGR